MLGHETKKPYMNNSSTMPLPYLNKTADKIGELWSLTKLKDKISISWNNDLNGLKQFPNFLINYLNL